MLVDVLTSTPRNPVLKSLLKAAPLSQMLCPDVWKLKSFDDWLLFITIEWLVLFEAVTLEFSVSAAVAVMPSKSLTSVSTGITTSISSWKKPLLDELRLIVSPHQR